ncbi:MAG: enoyl-CoA hydratase/isomerase family protein [Burkholderiaceae bacterium]|nr:enoyl-CoA hydratase/isomerase family protein [Burkholderiaceae bacterium]GIL03899.1 MAG: enoyl-CoA hydratase [Betaproteobacteria bacterium]
MDYETLELSINHRVAVVWLAREKVRNAFNETMIAELTRVFSTLGADAGVRAIVLAAKGPAFCAGADLDWMRRMAGYSHEDNRRDALALADMLRTIDSCPKPVIARVHGDAYAGGMGLVAVADVAIAALPANFCLSETKLGLIPATIGPYVIRAIGARAARRYFLTAERFDSGEAFRLGLVHNITPPEQLDPTINELLGALMHTSIHAVGEAKKLVRDLAGRPLDDALVADTAERIAAIRASDDGREGVRAFLDKRKPRWLAEYEAEMAAEQGDDEEM